MHKAIPMQSVQAALGSHAARRLAADLTGPVSESLAWRINGAHQQSGGFRDSVGSERSYLAPSVV